MRAKLTSLTIFALLITGCTSLNVQKDYVAADRATYSAVAPEYVAYINSDTSLSSDDKALKLDTIRLWNLRLQKFEGK